MEKEKKLNMPKTDFTQRSESQKREPELLKFWNGVDPFLKRNEMNVGDVFTLHDGKITNFRDYYDTAAAVEAYRGEVIP